MSDAKEGRELLTSWLEALFSFSWVCQQLAPCHSGTWGWVSLWCSRSGEWSPPGQQSGWSRGCSPCLE